MFVLKNIKDGKFHFCGNNYKFIKVFTSIEDLLDYNGWLEDDIKDTYEIVQVDLIEVLHS